MVGGVESLSLPGVPSGASDRRQGFEALFHALGIVSIYVP